MDEILIEEVRSRTILYDLGHSDYKNLKKKEYAWREVAAKVKMNESECRKRWKGLRDSYKRCKRMEQVASGSSAETPQKKWRYFEALSFLQNVSSSRPTIGNVCNDVFEQEEYLDVIDLDSADSILSPASVCSTTSLRGKKKNDSEKFQEFLDLAASSFSETCGAAAMHRKEQNSTSLVFESLAVKIKDANMPPNIVHEIEAKVSALVFAEISCFYSVTQ